MGPFDNHQLGFECPRCRVRITESLGRLKNEGVVTCPTCQEQLSFRAEQTRDCLLTMERDLMAGRGKPTNVFRKLVDEG